MLKPDLTFEGSLAQMRHDGSPDFYWEIGAGDQLIDVMRESDRLRDEGFKDGHFEYQPVDGMHGLTDRVSVSDRGVALASQMDQLHEVGGEIMARFLYDPLLDLLRKFGICPRGTILTALAQTTQEALFNAITHGSKNGSMGAVRAFGNINSRAAALSIEQPISWSSDPMLDAVRACGGKVLRLSTYNEAGARQSNGSIWMGWPNTPDCWCARTPVSGARTVIYASAGYLALRPRV